MKYALVHDQRSEAKPSLLGLCLFCGAAMVAKCGEKRVWHWAHRGKRQCDHWWEPETDWHRSWKNRFPVKWQEVIQTAEDGEKHIADVKTDQDWVIEFQHSYIKPEERRSRESFYGNLVWVVNGLRRTNDLKKFIAAVKQGIQIFQKPLVLKVHPLDCRLVEEWSTSRVPVCFDFCDKISPHGLWLLVPMGLDNTAYFVLVGKEDFISWHGKGDFNPQPIIDLIKKLEHYRVRAIKARYASHLIPMPYIPGNRGPRARKRL
jgi:hypothetical protein